MLEAEAQVVGGETQDLGDLGGDALGVCVGVGEGGEAGGEAAGEAGGEGGGDGVEDVGCCEDDCEEKGLVLREGFGEEANVPVAMRPGKISLRKFPEPKTRAAPRAPSSHPTPPTILPPITPATVIAIPVPATFSCRSQSPVTSKKSAISTCVSTWRARTSLFRRNIMSDLNLSAV